MHTKYNTAAYPSLLNFKHPYNTGLYWFYPRSFRLKSNTKKLY